MIPSVDCLLGRSDLARGAAYTTKSVDDFANYAHVMIGTDNRYHTQAPTVPFLTATENQHESHIRCMAEFVFDREAVRTAMKALGVSQPQLAEAVGLTHKSAVAKILNGTRQVKVHEAAKIYERLKLIPIEHSSTKTVPLIGMASAGRWREAIEDARGRMLIPAGVGGKRTFAVEVTGTSMNRVIPEGAWIVVDPDDKSLVNEKIYLIQNGEYEVTVKRYRTHPARFEPSSDDPAHEPFLVSDCEFIVLGRVCWQGGPV
jgi:repressor LexA